MTKRIVHNHGPGHICYQQPCPYPAPHRGRNAEQEWSALAEILRVSLPARADNGYSVKLDGDSE